MHTYIHNNPPPTTTPNMYRNLKQKQKTDHYILCPSRKYERKRRKKQRKIDKTLHPSPHTHTHNTVCVSLRDLLCFAGIFLIVVLVLFFMKRKQRNNKEEKNIPPFHYFLCWYPHSAVRSYFLGHKNAQHTTTPTHTKSMKEKRTVHSSQ